MEEMQITSDLTWIEVQFMKKAVDEVDKCRMTLKWTYAMAYYLEKCNQKELFEDNQRLVYPTSKLPAGTDLLRTDLTGIWNKLSRICQSC